MSGPLDYLVGADVKIQVCRIAATPFAEKVWKREQQISPHGWICAIGDAFRHGRGLRLTSIAARDLLPHAGQCVSRPIEPESALLRQAMAAFGSRVHGKDCNCMVELEGRE